MVSIREQLRGRPLPTETVPLPADVTAWATAHAELTEAAAAEQDALRRGRASASVIARRETAQSAVDKLSRRVFIVRTLPRDDWEALVGEHPVQRDEDQAAGYDPDGFYPALLEHTVTLDGESSTAAEWQELFASGELGPGEVNTLINAALRLHTTATIVQESVGKDSAQTRL